MSPLGPKFGEKAGSGARGIHKLRIEAQRSRFKMFRFNTPPSMKQFVCRFDWLLLSLASIGCSLGLQSQPSYLTQQWVAYNPFTNSW